MVRAVTVVGVLALAATTRAQPAPTRREARVLIGVGASAGLESPPGIVALLETGIGFRVGTKTTWYVRPAWSLFASMAGGGSSDLSYRIKEVRTGPTWWMCGESTCSGVSAELGIQYLRSHERGGDGDVPVEDTRRDYMIVGDIRLRGMAPSRGRVSVEVSLALRLKRTLYSTGQVNEQNTAGGGLLLGLGVFGRF